MSDHIFMLIFINWLDFITYTVIKNGKVYMLKASTP